MSFDWKSLIGTVAPTIATAVGGPAGGMAVKLITETLGLKKKATDQEIYEAVQTNPDALVKLKDAEYAFKKHLSDNDVKLADIAAKDTDSARKRQIALKDKAPAVIAGVVIIGYFGLIAILAFYDIKNVDVLTLLLGALSTAFGSIVAYYFGSSAGSKEKTALMSKTNGQS